MTCSSCGATIADKAIVCYRCGTPTAIPASPPPSGRSSAQKPPSGPFVPVVIGVILVVVAAVVWFLTR